MNNRLNALAVAVATVFAPALASADTFGFSHLWTYDHASTGVVGQTAEIGAFDATTNTIWVAGIQGVDVLSAATGSLVQHIDTTSFGFINSVAIYNGVAAFAIENGVTRTDAGLVAFYNTASFANTGTVSVGALPDMLTFSADGSRLLVANEGTPTTYGAYDPVGSVSIIDMGSRTVTATVSFASAATSGSYLRTNTGMDYEPEYITLNAAGTKAFVGLQEANAMGVIDLTTNTATKVVGLGAKDFSATGNAIDPNHKDSKIELRPAAVKGLYQPDGMAAYEVGGKTYIVMANEGDTREDDGDKLRVKDSGLSGYPADLKQLNISTTDSTSGSNLVTFGGRSFSIRDENGNIVFDSGNLLDAEAIARGIYDDNRSDDKGVEPEGVSLLKIDGHTLAFIGLERTTSSAVAVFDVTDPANASFLDMIVTEGTFAPEGLSAYAFNGKYYLMIANEADIAGGVVGKTALYEISAPVPEPETYALMLAGLGLVGFMVRRRKVS